MPMSHRRKMITRALRRKFKAMTTTTAAVDLDVREETEDNYDSLFSVCSDDDLKAILRFLLDEVSELRSLTRHLLAESPRFEQLINDTRDSFNFQWGDIKEGTALLSDPDFVKNAAGLVEEYTGLPRDWFKGKRVLDAGCGNGRWSATFCALGAEVTSFDISDHGVAETREACTGGTVTVLKHNVLEPLPFDDTFDLVWSYGVLHHTGDTWTGFQNLLPAVAGDGYFFLMLYGEPRAWVPGEFRELNLYQRMRGTLRGRSSVEKKELLEEILEPQLVHGFFDAVSPPINDCYSRSEVTGWLRGAGFQDIRETLDNRNIHIIGQKHV